MALLPEITHDLARVAGSSETALAEFATSFLASGYSLGVVFGLVLVPALMRRLPDIRVLQICAGALLVLTLAVAMSPSLALAVPFRFLSAMVHATYLGTASIVVARLLGAGRDGRGASIVIGGMAAANLLLVPLLTAVGAVLSWRVGLTVAALLCLPAVLVFFFVTPPDADQQPAVSVSDEVKQGAGRVTLLALAVVTLSAGLFATFSFIAPILRALQGGEFVIPMALVMLAFGLGMNVGNFLGGVQADKTPVLGIWLWSAFGAIGFTILLIEGESGIASALGAAGIGLAMGGITPCAQVVFLRLMAHKRRLAASMAPASINLGNFAGTTVGGASMVVLGIGTLPVVSLLFVAAGVVILLVLTAGCCDGSGERSDSRTLLIGGGIGGITPPAQVLFMQLMAHEVRF